MFRPSASLSLRTLLPVFAVESLSSVGSTLLMVGIFFYTERRFGWGLKQNLLLSAGQGLAYMIGSLAAGRVAGRFGHRRALIVVSSILTFIPLVTLMLRSTAMVTLVLLLYPAVIALAWPAMESLMARGADPHAMSGRVGIYNLVWSGSNAITFAFCGYVIQHAPRGLFLLPAGAHFLAVLVLLSSRRLDYTPAESHDHLQPEPALLASRTLALWLSRIALPATYVAIFSLSAMMPSLPVLKPLDTSTATLVGSVWMITRWVAFLLLGVTAWWHTRPRILLLATAAMLLAFWGVTFRPSDLYGLDGVGQTIELGSMMLWQSVFGLVIGVIYAGSLYFGMVLSDGSTEHGGYHEALIGLGSVIGPGAAALTQWRWPGEGRASVVAVSCILGLTLFAACVASARATRRAAPRPVQI